MICLLSIAVLCCASSVCSAATKKTALEVASAAKQLSEEKGGPIRIIVSHKRTKGHTGNYSFAGLTTKPTVKSLRHVGIDIVEYPHGESVDNVLKATEFISGLPSVKYQEADSIRLIPAKFSHSKDHHLSEIPLPTTFGGSTSVQPNDPRWIDMWGMKDIDAPMAWTVSTGENSPIRPRVVVIDTGVDYTHPDLVKSIWTNEAEANGKPGVDDDGNGYIDDIHGWNAITGKGDPMDNYGHGTHVSGTIGATGNNLLGVPGVNWFPEIVGCKFLDEESWGFDSDAIECIDYSISVNATISNNSWGGAEEAMGLEEAIEAARDAGQLFVASAGNNGEDNNIVPQYPSSYQTENIIAVAAVDATQGLAWFSNYGNTTVHLAAPGVDILSLFLGEMYYFGSGASMAVAHVSGVAALMKGLHPTIDFRGLMEHLKAGVVPFRYAESKLMWAGKLNAYQSLLRMGLTTTTEPPTAPPSDVVRVIVGASSLTCEENCAQGELVCHEEETTKMNTSVDYCHKKLSDLQLPIRFVNSHEEMSIPTPSFPAGCFTKRMWTFSRVVVNTNDYKSGLIGCNAPAAALSKSAKPCACVDH